MEPREAIEKLQHARSRAACLEVEVAAARAKWESENAHVLEMYQAAQKDEDEAGDAVRTMAKEMYTAGDRSTKDIMPGVGIIIKTIIDYDSRLALQWAKDHGLALKLDQPLFERIVKEDTPDFVTVGSCVSTRISTKLDEVLAGWEEVPSEAP